MSIVVADSVTGYDDAIRDMAGRVLKTHYPGYIWGVQAEEEQGICNILLISATAKYGYRLKLNEVYSATSFEHDVMIAGGELLERYKLSRSKLKPDQYFNARVDARGDLIGDISK